MVEARKRVSLASKIFKSESIEEKSKQNNNWFTKAAEEAGLDLDENLLDEGQAGGDLRDQQKKKEAAKAKEELKKLLKQPMRAQKFGKFLSSKAIQNVIESGGGAKTGDESGTISAKTKIRKKKRKKR